MNMTSVEHFFPADHPAAHGHFPGNPIIPGALLLSETLRAIESGLNQSAAPLQLASAKFLHPTRPGDRVRIEFTHAAQGAIRFTCAVGTTTVLTGMVSYGAS